MGDKPIGAMKRQNHEQGSCPADQPPPSYEEIAGSSQNVQQASLGEKSFPPEYPPTWGNRAAAGQAGLSSIPRLWSQFCQDCLLFLPGNSEHHHLQQTKYDGMGSLLRSLLHHAVALLLCSLLCGQLEECETHLSQLQIYPWSLQGWSLGSGSHPTIFVRNFRVAIYSQQ